MSGGTAPPAEHLTPTVMWLVGWLVGVVGWWVEVVRAGDRMVWLLRLWGINAPALVDCSCLGMKT